VTTTPLLPCAACYYDARMVGKPVWGPGHGRRDLLIGHHDGWRPCPTPATDDVALADGSTRRVCTEHARQITVLVAAGLADRLRWRW
jgi:hypothetical protein